MSWIEFTAAMSGYAKANGGGEGEAARGLSRRDVSELRALMDERGANG